MPISEGWFTKVVVGAILKAVASCVNHWADRSRLPLRFVRHSYKPLAEKALQVIVTVEIENEGKRPIVLRPTVSFEGYCADGDRIEALFNVVHDDRTLEPDRIKIVRLIGKIDPRYPFTVLKAFTFHASRGARAVLRLSGGPPAPVSAFEFWRQKRAIKRNPSEMLFLS